ncbi:hypothetical protein OIE75_41165 (plasmid) [Streptomyces sp. NBC_01723]|uniref:hypothetical protein n=1 Tax=Streptomyces sp. NBC_01723 TaxID=2975921 RepID=UPI002E31B280|nr:hypothetical protein [Streptomyces sp. NBC_01723]
MNHPDSTDSATARLRQLTEYHREHPVTSAEGHSYISSAPRGTITSPPLPFNVRVLEHIDRTVAEVITTTREANPDPGPIPDDNADIYRWCVEATANAPEAVQQRRDTLEYRHRLEHALAAGDTTVIRRHRCPDCQAPGLFWRNNISKAMCVNRHCARRTSDGRHRTFSLAELAHEYVQGRKNLRQVRAT